jgi:predicted esterase
MSSQGLEQGPHQGQPVLMKGVDLRDAEAAMILVHGRYASAQDILSLAPELRLPQVAYVAPQAAQSTWYPHTFLGPLEDNEPFLSSALQALADISGELNSQGIPPEQTFLLGFSQGACLVSEFAVRNPRRYGGVFCLTGGLHGPPGTPRRYEGSLCGTPIVLGSSDPDPYIPWSRVEETAEVFRAMGADIDLRRYPGLGHTINAEEIELVRQVVLGLPRPGQEDSDDRPVSR